MTEGRRGLALHTRILLGLAAGAACGGLARHFAGDGTILETFAANVTDPIGQLFLRLLLLLVIPLVGSSLVVGVAGLGDVRRIGRVGARCLIYTIAVSAVSVVIGLTVTNLIRPGERVSPNVATQLRSTYGDEAAKRVDSAAPAAASVSPASRVVNTLVPMNVVAAAASQPPDMLGLMFFSILFGVALTMVDPAKSAGLLSMLEAIYEATIRCIGFVMRLAPVAVFSLLFSMTARFGFDLLGSLGWFVGTVLLGLAIQMFGVYSISVAALSRMNPVLFFKRIETVIVTAFSTSSSNATLPTAMRVSEEKLGVPREINSFVLTIGATANQNGTALFEGVTVLFLAQLAGVQLGLGQQLLVLYLAILGGIGTAGVPAGSIPFVIVVLSTVGVNPELIAIVLGVDRLLDMCRTTLNVTGDLTIATYVARAEGHSLAGDVGTS